MRLFKKLHYLKTGNYYRTLTLRVGITFTYYVLFLTDIYKIRKHKKGKIVIDTHRTWDRYPV